MAEIFFQVAIGVGKISDFDYIYEDIFQTPQPWLQIVDGSYLSQYTAFAAFVKCYTSEAIQR